MLVSILSSQYARFAALAESWLALGASAFGVWQDGRPIVYWPSSHRLTIPSLRAPLIMQGTEEIGELRVAGITGTAFEQRLRADAELISYLLQLEEELQQITADLVTSQDQQLALYRLTQRMREYVTVEQTLDVVVKETMRILKAEVCCMMFVPSSGQDALLVQQPEGFLSDDYLWQLYWQGLATEHSIHLPKVRPSEGSEGLYNLLYLPLRIRNNFMAGLAIINRSGGFGTPDIKLSKAIADQASAQIDRVLLYQEMFDQAKLRTEMDLARRVQLELLPPTLPSIPGLDIYAQSRPASEVGGDFYDFVVQDGRPFIFVIGDVTGKGLSAALLMTMTRTAIHSKAQFMPYPTPEAIMRQSNEDLYNDFTRVGVFATALVGQFEPGSNVLMYANAGHAPVIYRPCDGEAVLLRADSTAIGILPVNPCRNQRLRLGPGDLLIVATDGFTDVRDNDDDLLGIERLLQLVNASHHKNAHQIAEAFFAETEHFGQGGQQDDDQTLVILKGAVS